LNKERYEKMVLEKEMKRKEYEQNKINLDTSRRVTREHK